MLWLCLGVNCPPYVFGQVSRLTGPVRAAGLGRGRGGEGNTSSQTTIFVRPWELFSAREPSSHLMRKYVFVQWYALYKNEINQSGLGTTGLFYCCCCPCCRCTLHSSYLCPSSRRCYVNPTTNPSYFVLLFPRPPARPSVRRPSGRFLLPVTNCPFSYRHGLSFIWAVQTGPR